MGDFEELSAANELCVENISSNMGRVCNQNTSAKATSFYKLMVLFDFLSSLVIARSILDLTLPITQFCRVQQYILLMQHILLNHWKNLFVANVILLAPFIKGTIVLKCYWTCFKLGIDECKPRTSKLQRNCKNVP